MADDRRSAAADRKRLPAEAAGAAAPGRKIIVKSVDMKEEMQKEAVDCAITAFEKCTVEKDVSEYIKKEFDKNHGPTWHCIVGRNFGKLFSRLQIGKRCGQGAECDIIRTKRLEFARYLFGHRDCMVGRIAASIILFICAVFCIGATLHIECKTLVLMFVCDARNKPLHLFLFGSKSCFTIQIWLIREFIRQMTQLIWLIKNVAILASLWLQSLPVDFLHFPLYTYAFQVVMMHWYPNQ